MCTDTLVSDDDLLDLREFPTRALPLHTIDRQLNTERTRLLRIYFSSYDSEIVKFDYMILDV